MIYLSRSLFLGLVLLSPLSLHAEGVSQAESDAARIAKLEMALQPQSPEALAKMFAEANKNRNGAVQYMLFSDSLKNKYKDQWPYWTSGVSSPWITGYELKDEGEGKFRITYQQSTAEGPFKPDMVQLIEIESVPLKMECSSKFWIKKLTEF